MAWIKRNLIFVIIAAVGVLLTGFCAYLLYSAMQKNSTVSDDYTQTVNSLDQLRQKRPYPDTQAITVADEDQGRVRAFLGDFQKAFAPFPPPPHEDARGFKDYLQRTIYQLGIDATNANVLLPPDYSFSWSQQKERLNYPEECIGPWMRQLEEEKAILRILFDAHIDYLEYVQRVPTACDDSSGPDYISTTVVSNSWGVIAPYAIAFRGFSSDLAAVLAGFAHSSNCFIVKEVSVTQSKAQLPQVIAPETPGAAPAPVYQQPQYQPQYQMRPRFGGERTPYYPPPRQVITGMGNAAPAVAAPPMTILTENPLYIKMAVDVVQLK